jgi:hypothetical protein
MFGAMQVGGDYSFNLEKVVPDDHLALQARAASERASMLEPASLDVHNRTGRRR